MTTTRTKAKATTETAAAPQRPESANEIIDSLTGHDERHLEQMTGMTFDAMTQRGEMSRLTRGLIAIQIMREEHSKNTSWQAAWGRVLGMSRTELNTFFTPDTEDIDNVLPEIGAVTEVGKDG